MRKLFLSLLVCMLFFTTSCTLNEIKTSTIELKKNGSINAFILEPFDIAKYQEVDLKNWVTIEISNYNIDKEDKIILKDLYVEEGSAMLSVKFPTCEDYMKLNGEVLFFGTIEEVMGPEFCLVGDYFNSDGLKVTLTEEDLLKNVDLKVLISKEPICVSTYKDALFYSQNINKIKSKTYDLVEQKNQELNKEESNDEEYYILIFE